MAKRATTDHSFIIGIDKPYGITSHDVVNQMRTIYKERRIGHTGTLDPAATGVLCICVGPATRLDRFLSGKRKTYEFTCVFGAQTDTDDAQGNIIETMPIPSNAADASYAQEVLATFMGPSEQMPPIYSSIKVGGKTAHREARAGHPLNLEPRPIEIYSLELLDITAHDTSSIVWNIRADVSAGTYIRSLARDIGQAVNSTAHVGDLRRTRSGVLTIEECVSIEAVEQDPLRYLLDPVKLLGYRFMFAEGDIAQKIASGSPLHPQGVKLHAYALLDGRSNESSCTSGVVVSSDALAPGETIAMIVENKLSAIYAYDQESGLLKSTCGFSKGVQRGPYL